jgi:hypothetical protein
MAKSMAMAKVNGNGNDKSQWQKSMAMAKVNGNDKSQWQWQSSISMIFIALTISNSILIVISNCYY